jgi:hypothetical protein
MPKQPDNALLRASRKLDAASKGTGQLGSTLLALAFLVILAVILVPIGLKALGI